MSEKSVSLLLTEDYDEAAEISSQLCVDNSERQEIERDILEKIDGIIRRKPSLVNDKIIVIDGENWHQGVIGLIAAKVKEAYGKPAIVISKLGDIAKGSGRSVEDFLFVKLFLPVRIFSHTEAVILWLSGFLLILRISLLFAGK